MRITLTILFLVMLSAVQAQTNEKVHTIAESGLYVSGDLMHLQLVVLNASGEPISHDRIIHAFLVSHQGEIVLKRKFLITEIDKAGFILLPADLESGKYKLVTCLAGGGTRTETMLSVYNPNIFASSIPPDNADTRMSIEVGLPENTLSSYTTSPLKSAHSGSITVENPGNSGIMTSKIYDPRFETPPVTGRIVNDPVPAIIEDQLSFEYISRNPNSRISLYFVEQGFVEEFYLAEEAKIMEKLPALFGSGHVFAYQFDQEGNRLGQIPAKVQRAGRISFDSFDNTIPFDEGVRNILEKKRIRKYVEQVYQSGDLPVVSLMSEEYNTTPDRRVDLDNYAGVATLREALANITPKTQVIRRDKSYEVRLSPEKSGFRYDHPPLILVNGIPTFDLDSLFEMPAGDIESVQVFISLEKLRRFGTFGRYGVLSITLRDSFDNPFSSTLDSMPVYFGVSDLVSEPVKIDGPDLRPVAFWDPAIRFTGQSDITLRFRNSNVTGDYILWSWVIMEDGATINSSKTFTVQP